MQRKGTTKAENQVLVITGMHRSGTSLLAHLAQDAGVHMGEDLLQPNRGNPRGFFEDLDFIELQQRMLNRGDHGVFVSSPSLRPEPDEEDRVGAGQLVAARSGRSQWGWKDPRTSLYLDFWDEQLEQARYLLVYRDPIDVLLSLRNRASDIEIMGDPVLALLTWQTYNSLLLSFAQRHRDRCFLADIYGIVDDLDGFVSAVNAKLGLSLSVTAARERCQPQEMARCQGSTQLRSALALLGPDPYVLLQQLADHADWPAAQRQSAPSHAGLTTLHSLIGQWIEEGADIERVASPLLLLTLALVDPKHTSGAELRTRLGITAAETRKLRAEFEERSRWAADLDRQLSWREQQLMKLQEEFDERTEWALELNKQVRALQQQLNELRSG